MGDLLEILEQKVGKDFFNLLEAPEGMMYDSPEMYVDRGKIIGVSKISENSLKPTIRYIYKERIKLEQFSKEIKKESKDIYVIKGRGEYLGYSRDYIRIALLILDREKTMVSIPSEPAPLRMYDDIFDIYLAPKVEEEDIEMSKENLFNSKKAEIERNISYLLKLTDCNNRLQKYIKEIFREKMISKRTSSDFLIMFKTVKELISKDYIKLKDTLKELVK